MVACNSSRRFIIFGDLATSEEIGLQGRRHALERNTVCLLLYVPASCADMGSKSGDPDEEPIYTGAKQRTAPGDAAAPAASAEQPSRLTRQGSRQSREPTAEPEDAAAQQGSRGRATRTASGRKSKGEAQAAKPLSRTASQAAKVDRSQPPPITADTIPFTGPHEIAVG